MTVATGTKPHPIFLAGRWVDSPDILEVANPADPANPAGVHLQRDTRAVRRGGHRRGRGVRGHADAARLRARPDPARDLGWHQGPARRAGPAHRARGRQADPRCAGRGRSGDADVPTRRRGGRAHDRRADPARPHACIQGSRRHHTAVPDRTDRRDLAVQLPAQPRGAQAVAGDRQRQHDRAQATVQGPTDDADHRRDRRGRRRPGRGGQHPADDPRARRPDGRRRAIQAARPSPVAHPSAGG